MCLLRTSIRTRLRRIAKSDASNLARLVPIRNIFNPVKLFPQPVGEGRDVVCARLRLGLASVRVEHGVAVRHFAILVLALTLELDHGLVKALVQGSGDEEVGGLA